MTNALTFTKDAILITLMLLTMLIPVAVVASIVVHKAAAITVAVFAIKAIGAMLVALTGVELVSLFTEEC